MPNEQGMTTRAQLNTIVAGLSASARKALKTEVQAVQSVLESTEAREQRQRQKNQRVGERVRAAAYARRRLVLTWRDVDKTQGVDSYDEAAKILGCSTKTLQVYLSHGKGQARFAAIHDGQDDIIKVTRYQHGKIR